MTEPTLRAFTSDGITLRYLDWGAADAEPVVLLHGIRDQARAWDPVAMALAERYRVIALDLRGHGDSDWSPDGAYMLPYHVGDVVALIETLGYPTIRLIGHSFGGSLASRYAGLYPDRIAQLVLVDGFGPSARIYAQWAEQGAMQRSRDFIEQRRAAAAPPRILGSIEDGMARLAKGNPRLDEAQLRHLATHGLRAVDGGYRWKFDPRLGIFAPEDFAQRADSFWREITAPTLLCWGAESWSAAKPGDYDIAALRDHKTAAIPGAGHWPHHDNLDGFLTAVRGFLG